MIKKIIEILWDKQTLFNWAILVSGRFGKINPDWTETNKFGISVIETFILVEKILKLKKNSLKKNVYIIINLLLFVCFMIK